MHFFKANILLILLDIPGWPEYFTEGVFTMMLSYCIVSRFGQKVVRVYTPWETRIFHLGSVSPSRQGMKKCIEVEGVLAFTLYFNEASIGVDNRSKYL